MPAVELVRIECALCGEVSYKHPRYLHHNAKQGKAGPFCSRSCSCKYAANVHYGGERLPPQKEIPRTSREYHKKSEL
mgnify:CR=1 FL=1